MRIETFFTRYLFNTLLFGSVILPGAGKAFGAPPDSQEIKGQEIRARMSTEAAEVASNARVTLQRSTDLYASIVKGRHGEVPESVLAKAECIAVIPDVITGAAIVGGSHGTGIASCKENNKWSQPAFLKLNSISFGAQVGGKSTDLVLFMVNQKAKNALKAGKITLGSDVSVTAGTFDRGLDPSTSGVIAYNRTEGAFAGASVSGGTLSGDDEYTAAIYGPGIKYSSLMEGVIKTAQNNQVDMFTKLLPK